MLTKRITAFICAIAVLAGGAMTFDGGEEITTALAAGSVTKTDGESSSNNIDTAYHIYDNQDKTIKSYLYESGENTLTRVEYTGSKLIAEDIDMKTGLVKKSRTLDMALPIFGAFYEGEDYNFVVTGQENSAESNDTKIISVTRYSKDFKSSKTVTLYGRNTTIPFKAGSCKMTELKGKLYIHTCHQMYQSDDGLHHQANMSYVLDEDTMEFEQEHYRVVYHYSSAAFDYVSHSFDQFLAADDEAVYSLDHGDAYPRALQLSRYDTTTSRRADSELISIPGSTGANYTSVLTGSMQLSKDNVLIGLKMDDMSNGSLGNYYDLKDIYIMTVPKSAVGSSVTPTLVNLTNYSSKTQSQSSSGKRNSAPKMVKINDNKFIVMWKESIGSTSWWSTSDREGITKIAVIDGSGKLIGGVMESSEINLSDCDPILCSDGMVRWYTANGSSPVLYALDPDEPSNFSARIAGDANSDGDVTVADVLLIQQHLAKWNVTIDKSAADVTGDGEVTVADVLLIQQYLAKWNVTLK